ncbi:MAG: hypothetical protein JWN32_352 [Solirubrobacterales bacterium]|jgi:integral membrane sensor domain MASE1|nr:hypothetical protein [Solirubrobacterales bacterium]
MEGDVGAVRKSSRMRPLAIDGSVVSQRREDRHRRRRRRREEGRYALQIVAVAGVYAASGKLGLHLAFAIHSVSAIWPPTGIALVALILGGYRLWPAVALGALLTNLDTGVPAVTVLGITCGNTLEALVGAYLLRRVARFRPSLERVRDVLSLVACGAVLSTMVSASVGVASLLLGDAVAFAHVPSVWRTWWLGDMGGDLIVAPVLLVAASHRRFRRLPGRPAEAVALVLVLAGVSVLVFSQSTNLVYVVFPLLTWAALRFWQPGATAGSLMVAAVAVTFTANGKGPFATSGPDDRLLLAQTFVAVAGVSALVLAAVTSERRRAERAEREIAATLQQSLVPRQLPEVPGVSRAAYFSAAGEGHLVGGDFYDLFRVSDGRWAVILGDVCGKGPRAAALTALARHTLRAASLRERLPSRVLASLNEAVRRQDDDAGALCTAIYATLDLNGASAAVTMSSGGHPLPLILRADGSVAELGEPGSLLGVDPQPFLVDHSVELLPGDTILLYSDGLIEAYAPGRIVHVSELESILASCAGSEPPQIIAAIERSLLDSRDLEPRDDVAIVVLQVTADPAPDS